MTQTCTICGVTRKQVTLDDGRTVWTGNLEWPHNGGKWSHFAGQHYCRSCRWAAQTDRLLARLGNTAPERAL